MLGYTLCFMGLRNSCARNVKDGDLSLLSLKSSLAIDLFLNNLCDSVNLMCIISLIWDICEAQAQSNHRHRNVTAHQSW